MLVCSLVYCIYCDPAIGQETVRTQKTTVIIIIIATTTIVFTVTTVMINPF
jgi:hypothetical protein